MDQKQEQIMEARRTRLRPYIDEALKAGYRWVEHSNDPNPRVRGSYAGKMTRATNAMLDKGAELGMTRKEIMEAMQLVEAVHNVLQHRTGHGVV